MKTRFKVFYFVQFLSFGILGPYLSLYLSKKGFTGAQIGVILGMVPLLTVLLQPIWSYLSDVFNKKRLLLTVACVGVSLSTIGLALSQSFISAFLLSIPFAIFFTPITTLSTSIILEYLDENEASHEYGFIRVWGSIAYAASSLLLASLFLDRILDFFPWILMGVYLLLAILSTSLPESKASFSRPNFKDLKVLLTNPTLMIFLVGTIFIGGTINVALNYQTMFLQSMDASDVLIGIITSLPSLLEVPMMSIVPVLLKRIPMRWFILAGAVILLIRWALYLLIQDPGWMLPAVLLNGISTVGFEVVGVSFIDKVVDQKWRVSGQGLYNAFMYGIGPGISVYLAGNVLGWFNIRAVWGLNLILGVIGLALVFIALWRVNSPAPQEVHPS